MNVQASFHIFYLRYLHTADDNRAASASWGKKTHPGAIES